LSELSLAYGADDAQVITQDTVFQGYFRMDALTLRHKRFDGSWTSGIRRELFQRGDAGGGAPLGC
jgi:ADP-ribose pyrophosphatase